MGTSVTVVNHLGEVPELVKVGIVHGLNLGAERLLTLTIPRTPLGDTGNLRDSGAVVPAELDMSNPTSSVVFDTPYAAWLHEHPEYNFTEPGTGGKYLENTAAENRAEIGAVIAKGAGL